MINTDEEFRDIPYEYIKDEPAPAGVPKEEWEKIQRYSLDFFNYLRRYYYNIPDSPRENSIIIMAIVKAIVPFYGLLSAHIPTKDKRLLYNLVINEIEVRFNALINACGERDKLV